MNIKKFKAFVATAGILALGSLAPAVAFNQGNTVTMGGIPIFDIDCPAEGFSAERRAWQAQDALDNALFLTSDPGPDCVSVGRQNGAFVLKVGGRYVATADGASAARENMSSQALAEKWAGSLRDALSNPDRVAAYVATLKDPNKVEGGVIAERTLFAPAGTVLPVVFDQNLSASLIPGDEITGRIVSSIPVGGYFIPADSVLIGRVEEASPGVYKVHMDTLRTPSGTEVAINAVVTNRMMSRPVAPHQVATIGIPANSTTNTRVPATVGIGAGQLQPVTAMTFTKETDYKISRGVPTNVVLEQVSSVAVVPGRSAM